MTTPLNPTHVYWRPVTAGERTSLSVLCSFVKQEARVLDLGIGSGSLGQRLQQELGCRLDGVTINPQEQSVARDWYERIEVLNLEQPAWEARFEAGTYDAIVCADVLEHLARPEAVLAACRRLLRPEGVLLVSIPNVAYAGLVADLMQGNFEYGNEGLMDRTHLRFFTRRSFQRLLDSQDWQVESVEAIEQPLHETEYSMAFDSLPPSVARHVLAQPDASAYQLVFVARPTPQPRLQPRGTPAVDVVAATFVAELFVSASDGFSADRKITRFGKIGVEHQILRFEIPASLGGWPKLRLDPADRPGFFWLHRIALRDADSGEVFWEWLPTQDAAEQLTRCPRHQLDIGAPNGASEALSLLMLGDDPQVELPIPPEAASSASARDCVLDVECGWPLSADYLAAAQRFNQLEGRIEALSRRILELEATARTEAPAAQTQEATSIWRSIGALFDKNRADRPEVPVSRQRVSYDPVVEIVVPVYGNLHLVQRCLHSVQASTGTAAVHITVINDASPDLAVRTWLNEFALANPEVTVIENSRNLGFVETVNLGMRLAGRRDVVLLNSDTEVANDWLDRLRAAALSQDRAGTVTPFSNNATICSYPKFCEDNPLLPGHDTASTDRLVAQVNPGKVVDIPTAVGFCMYIRRACLDAVGDFDAASFGAGYGEENDFCLRATSLGWRHLHALDVFVYHEGGASFKESRFALQARALETIRRLHPGYEDLIREFVQRDPARPFRAAIDQARAPGEAPLNA